MRAILERLVEVIGDSHVARQRPGRLDPSLALRDETDDRSSPAPNHDLLAGLDTADQLREARLGLGEADSLSHDTRIIGLVNLIDQWSWKLGFNAR